MEPFEWQWETERAMSKYLASSYFNTWSSSFLSDIRKGAAT